MRRASGLELRGNLSYLLRQGIYLQCLVAQVLLVLADGLRQLGFICRIVEAVLLQR